MKNKPPQDSIKKPHIVRDQSVIVSTRVRLARNISLLPFPPKLKDERAKKLVSDAAFALGGDKTGFRKYTFLTEHDAFLGKVLKEKRLISDDLLANAEHSAVLVNFDNTISIMLLEEDHIRIQVILDGYNLKGCYEAASKIDDTLCKKMTFAFDAKLGYLTACPTNLGTGLRASCMMFLPGLTIYNSLSECVSAVARLNMEIRGVYGEGSDSIGYLYQLSNQTTLGLSEMQIMDALDISVRNIEEAELRARDLLKKQGTSSIQDKIQRAYGVLLSAYRLESSEFMQAMALVKLGAYYGYLKIFDSHKFERLMIEAQPASLREISGRMFETTEDRDVFRAEFVAKNIRNIVRAG